MIKAHEFNTLWWRKPVGIITDSSFFDLPAKQRNEHLAPFDWVEFRMPLEHGPVAFSQLHEAGFFQVDTQINYRLNLTRLTSATSLDELTVEFADESPFVISGSEFKPFEHERFSRLAGITPERLAQRYLLWSENHLHKHPSACLRILYQGRVEGWYLGDESGEIGLNLTLAMLSKDSDISGLLLFLKAYQAFAERGHRLGWASFSVQNTAVHNIYAAIGARFLNPVGHWFWLR